MSYFRNSYDLRQELCSMQYHPTAQLFTADAISKYTIISTNTAIMLIAKHIRTSIPEEQPKQNAALIVALKLVMLNNIFWLGDMTFKQMNGTAMGTLPAPPYATIYYGLHESPNSSHNTRIMSSSTNNLSTMFLESGYLILTNKSMQNYGKNSLHH